MSGWRRENASKPAGERGGTLRAAHRIVDGALQIWIGSLGALGLALRVLEIADHDHHQVVEIVGDAAAELTDGFHALRGGELLLRLAQRPLCLHALRHVARDLGEAEQVALLVANGIDDHEGPELGAVLANAPPLGLVATLARRRRQRPCRYAGGAVLLGVERAEMVPDDIGRRVTLDALRARVPGGHDAVRVELEDRVIHDGVDETAETRFALQQTLARLLALGHVARDLGKPEQHAIVVANGVDDGERPEASSVLANTPAFGLEPAEPRRRSAAPAPERPRARSSGVKKVAYGRPMISAGS